GRRGRIVVRSGKRAEFVRALNGQPYDSKMTYFFPGIKAAIEDLAATPGGGYDIRMIVLVTDGLPEPATRDREAELLRDELGPQLAEHNIRLYVLAFSQTAYSNRGFFDDMVRRPGGSTVGEIFVDPDGSKLLANMGEIFGRSFGFVRDVARHLPGVRDLDLDAGGTPEKVAVVVSSARSKPVPGLALAPPSEGALNAPGGVLSASEKGGSYSLTWVLSPNVGRYDFDTDVLRGSVAVLRPTKLALEILAAPAHRQAEKTMAETPFQLRVLVKPAGGTRGDPGPVDLSFRPLGERVVDSETGDSGYRYEGEVGAPPRGPGTVTADGRVYDVQVVFEENPEAPQEIYVGYLEVEARRGEALVGSLRAAFAHRVEVHPFLAISPQPLSQHVSNTALERQDRACTNFELAVDAGDLPHPDKPRYALRAALVPDDVKVLDRELHEATYTLDGRPLEVEKRAGPEPGEWYKGRELSQDELLGEHEICVAVGKPTAGDPADPVDLALVLTLLETPYDDFGVVKPFTLRVLIAPPSFLQKWRSLLVLGLTLLGLLAALWYSRDRPMLPDDLGYAVGRDGGTSDLVPRPLPEGSLAARLLGLVVERPILAAGEDRNLGWVRPAREELYQLRPARGMRLEAVDGETPAAAGKLSTVDVGRTYRLSGDRGRYLFRMEYQ
ncbi:MAG: hypothetical protein V3T72_09720, partial [Thermoanaerobaculia bacterium]